MTVEYQSNCFYGELQKGKRKPSKPRQRYKDVLKANLKKCKIPVESWEEMAADRPNWRKATHEGVNLFEKERIQYESYKRSVRKRELTVAPKEVKGIRKCEICGRICLSLAGLKSHMRSHEKSTVEQYPQQVGLKCVKCEKVAKSKSWHDESSKKSCKKRKRRRQSKTSYSRTS